MQRDWQTELEHGIPLVRAMQLSVQTVPDGRVRLLVPLGPNINDKGTGFGGSVAALATLAGWVETRRQLDLVIPEAAVDIVVQRGQTQYLAPIHGDFSAMARLPGADDATRFLRLFARRGVGRLAVSVDICCQDQVCATFDAEYVANRVA
jgi:thioesterase domain-containing protein